jgi:hypothetical protein
MFVLIKFFRFYDIYFFLKNRLPEPAERIQPVSKAALVAGSSGWATVCAADRLFWAPPKPGQQNKDPKVADQTYGRSQRVHHDRHVDRRKGKER